MFSFQYTFLRKSNFSRNNDADWFLSKSITVEAKDAVGMSPLVLAAILGHREVADLLFL